MPIAAITPEIVTIDQASAYLREGGVESAGASDILQAIINGATAWLYHWTGRKRLLDDDTSIVEYLHGDGGLTIMAHEWPIQSVSEVVLYPHDASQTVTLTGPGTSLSNDDMFWESDGYVHLKSYSTPDDRSSVKLTYKAGYQSTDHDIANIRQALLEMVLGKWQRFKTQSVGLDERRTESSTLSFSDADVDPAVRTALQMYRRWHS